MKNQKKISRKKKRGTQDVLVFKDFNFKLAVIQILMYEKQLIKPTFDVWTFAENYAGRKIDIDAEGYEMIPEVKRYFEELDISADLAHHITEIEQDGGDEIYLMLIPFWDGEDNTYDIQSVDDIALFPNLKRLVPFGTSNKLLKAIVDSGLSNGTEDASVEDDDGEDSCGLSEEELLADKNPDGDLTTWNSFNPEKPRAVVFSLDDIPGVLPLAELFSVSKRIQIRPFYFYDSLFEDNFEPPPEPSFGKAEDARGYAFMDSLKDLLASARYVSHILNPAEGTYRYIYGWHNGSDREALTRSLESQGFEVFDILSVLGHNPAESLFDYSLEKRLEVYREEVPYEYDDEKLPKQDEQALKYILTGAGKPAKASSKLLEDLIGHLDHPYRFGAADRRMFHILAASDRLTKAVADLTPAWWRSPEKEILPLFEDAGLCRLDYFRTSILAWEMKAKRDGIQIDADSAAWEIALNARDILVGVQKQDTKESKKVANIIKRIHKKMSKDLPKTKLPKLSSANTK